VIADHDRDRQVIIELLESTEGKYESNDDEAVVQVGTDVVLV
jgi:hypothetical protein